jgi:CelD/BcsL family acetyltransferase involved in cellulose biosynthesis
LRDLSPAYAVDLAAVRSAKGDYLALLSSNTRSQIRRSFKEHGDATITCATSPEEIDAWLADMRRLNTGRHEDNAWEHEGFRYFAATIARAGLDTGEVELLRINCGGKLTGYLLNFRYRGRAMNYQSAFIAPSSSKSKPGLMCHATAVGRYAEQGLALYSLLAGKDRYKQSLATSEEVLEWWSLERFSHALEIEALARRLLRR